MSEEEILDEFEIEHRFEHKNKTYILKNLIERIKIENEIFIRISTDNSSGIFFTAFFAVEEMKLITDTMIKRGWLPKL